MPRKKRTEKERCVIVTVSHPKKKEMYRKVLEVKTFELFGESYFVHRDINDINSFTVTHADTGYSITRGYDTVQEAVVNGKRIITDKGQELMTTLLNKAKDYLSGLGKLEISDKAAI